VSQQPKNLYYSSPVTYSINTQTMPWYNGDYPPSYKNQPPKLRAKAVEIANEILKDGAGEDIAIATGLKRAREVMKKGKKE
jgi:uncharacterized protein YdaT